MAEKKTEIVNPDDRESLPVWQQELVGLVERVAANPLPYLAGFAVIVLSLAAGGLYQLAAMEASKDHATELARANQMEDEDERLAALEEIAEARHDWSDEALYLAAEERFQRGDYDEAGRMYQAIVDEYPESRWAPFAAEGIAYIDEIKEAYLEAIRGYEGVRDRWPDSFAARRQSFNIARASETQNDMERAVGEYRQQIADFPDSNIAARAQDALDRLRDSHPGLFPEEVDTAAEESDDAIEININEPAAEGAEEAPATPMDLDAVVESGAETVSDIAEEVAAAPAEDNAEETTGGEQGSESPAEEAPAEPAP